MGGDAGEGRGAAAARLGFFGELLVAHLSALAAAHDAVAVADAAGGEGEGAGSGAAVAAMAARAKRLRAACLVTGAPDTSDTAGDAAPAPATAALRRWRCSIVAARERGAGALQAVLTWSETECAAAHGGARRTLRVRGRSARCCGRPWLRRGG